MHHPDQVPLQDSLCLSVLFVRVVFLFPDGQLFPRSHTSKEPALKNTLLQQGNDWCSGNEAEFSVDTNVLCLPREECERSPTAARSQRETDNGGCRNSKHGSWNQ